jgi:hypothetical protein
VKCVAASKASGEIVTNALRAQIVLSLKSTIVKTIKFLCGGNLAPHKRSGVNILLLSALFSTILMLAGCRKNLNDVAAPVNASSQSDQALKQYDASVATDWYKLQLRFLLEKNSVLASGGFFGYIGIGLYESVRYATPHSVSFSERLYQMPSMPEKEKGKSYNWQVSG